MIEIYNVSVLFQGNLSDLGKLLMQGAFQVWMEDKKTKIKDIRFKPMQRHVFLYEKRFLFCKKKDVPIHAEKASYIFKTDLQVRTSEFKVPSLTFMWSESESESILFEPRHLNTIIQYILFLNKKLKRPCGIIKPQVIMQVCLRLNKQNLQDFQMNHCSKCLAMSIYIMAL